MWLTIAQSNSATSLMKLAGIISTGVLGGACFTTGIVLRIEILTIVGICVLILCIIALLLYYILSKPVQQQHPTLSTVSAIAQASHYSTNNMNTMKRNKSDTDLELINRESAKHTIEDEQV
jgi:formate hydrogenlyase subunit 3/multisubunit Na+/H+ antiporter MnhD subunit